MKIEFPETPAVGLALMVNGQRFDLVEITDHQTASGGTTQGLLWRAQCATCGDPFLAGSSRLRFPENRRCEEHRSPGKRVR